MRSISSVARSFALAGFTALGLASGASSATLAFNFDSVASGTAANSAVGGASVHFDLASFLPELDVYGDPIPGSDAYRPDPLPADLVRVSDPSLRLYGSAPSPYNALDAVDQGVLLTFDSPVLLSSFQATLDLSAFGFPGTFDIVFQDAAGHVLHSLPTQQSIPGFIASAAGPFSGVASIYLPGGAFYDDLRLEVVPEPGAFALALLGLALVGLARTRYA